MGPDGKDTAQAAVYIDGQPVGTAYGEIPEISLVAEEPAEAMPPAVRCSFRQVPLGQPSPCS